MGYRVLLTLVVFPPPPPPLGGRVSLSLLAGFPFMGQGYCYPFKPGPPSIMGWRVLQVARLEAEQAEHAESQHYIAQLPVSTYQ